MFKILFSLWLAVSPLLSFAQTAGLPVDGKVSDATVFPGLLSPSNFVANPIAYPNVSNTNPPLNAGSAARDTTTGYKLAGKSSWKCTTTATNGYCAPVKLRPLTDEFEGGYCRIVVAIKGDASLHSVWASAGSTVKFSENIYRNFTTWDDYKTASFPCDKTIDNVRIVQTKAGTATQINYGFGFGKSGDIINIAQAYFFGGMEQVGAAGGTCTYIENSSSGLNDPKPLGTGTGCNAWTTSGSMSAVGTNSHAFTLSNMPPGSYQVQLIGAVSQSGGISCVFKLSDGANTYQAQVSGGANSYITSGLTWYIDNATGTKTYNIVASDSGTGSCYLDNSFLGGNLAWKVTYFPSQSQTALAANTPTSPTISILTGTGTYTTPVGATSLRVKMVGGGGGGAGSGSTQPNGGNGGSTTFGSSLLTATGGQGGQGVNAGTAGTASCGAITNCSPFSGSQGQGGASQAALALAVPGGAGGNSPLGGAGSGSASANGGNATVNSGSGGAGGSTTVNIGTQGGAGGSSGGYIEAIYLAPPTSIAYSVGVGGTGGAAGTSGFAGGNGAAGYLEVTAYYGAQNVPLLVGSVITKASGQDRVTRATININGASSCSILKSTPDVTNPIASSNICTLTISPPLSDEQTCVATRDSTGTDRANVAVNSTSSISVVIWNTSNVASTGAVGVLCSGPN